MKKIKARKALEKIIQGFILMMVCIYFSTCLQQRNLDILDFVIAFGLFAGLGRLLEGLKTFVYLNPLTLSLLAGFVYLFARLIVIVGAPRICVFVLAVYFILFKANSTAVQQNQIRTYRYNYVNYKR